MSDIFDTRFEGKEIELSDSRISLGDEINLMAKDPTIYKIAVGVGWDLNAFNADALDLDFSLFMLGKDDKTRVDEDMIFYNQPEGADGGIKHGGDSRTGAGDGDDEVISINLHNVSFEIMQIVFVITIYKGVEKEQNLGMVRNGYIRIVNQADENELLRYEFSKDLEDKTDTGVIVGVLSREGPKWHFKPMAEFAPGGLKEFAERYGMLIVQQ